MKRPPTLVVGAPRSGEGKTTVALGIMAAFRRRGLRVQGFKTGPDYLDTGYQVLATGRAGRNLDLWMMGVDAVERAVAESCSSADVIVVEGAMGLFDGHRNGVAPSSTADVAALLGAPVILVVDASRMGASIGALTLGFRTYDERVRVEGVILNRWAVRRDRKAASKAVERAGLKIFGYLPASIDTALPSRHLGLVMADEIAGEATRVIEKLADLMEAHLNLDALLGLAAEARRPERRPPREGPQQREGALPAVGSTVIASKPAGFEGREVRIAVAWDSAFAFYYQDNLDALACAGAVLVFFSPLEAAALPSCDGLYLGGGYPELHAEALSENLALRENIRRAIAAGLPTYAECGGLLYLCESLEDARSRRVSLVGAVPGRVVVHERLFSMGYREGQLARDCLLGHAGDVLRGHEFHYSECVLDRARLAGSSPAYILHGKPEGFVRGDLFASFIHLHFAGYPNVVKHWLKTCAAYSASPQRRPKERKRMSEALIILGHGSRSEAATKQFLELVDEVRKRRGGLVLPAFMELAEPSLSQALSEAAAGEVDRIIVEPCLLFNGNHVLHDIPEMIAELATEQPSITLLYGAPLGPDPRIVDVVLDRIEQAHLLVEART